jgi:hypothetical protein
MSFSTHIQVCKNQRDLHKSAHVFSSVERTSNKGSFVFYCPTSPQTCPPATIACFYFTLPKIIDATFSDAACLSLCEENPASMVTKRWYVW